MRCGRVELSVRQPDPGAARPDVWICEVSPRTELPELTLSWRTQDRSPVLRAFLGSAGTAWPRLHNALQQRGISADSAG